jgi:Fe-S cluster assembly ATPase SufC
MLHIQNLTVKFEQKKILRSINLDIPQQGVVIPPQKRRLEK